MVKATRGVSQVDGLRQGASHCLFVEGKVEDDGRDEVGFDVPVLKELLADIIDVKPLGASFSVKNVAEALHPHHSNYYFLADRDHHDDAFVKKCWRSFPDPKTHNLLVWRRRELESYFLISSYLEKMGDEAAANPRRKKSRRQIDEIVRRACAERLYLDAANQVIAEVREANKENWIEFFTNTAELSDPTTARKKLVERPEFGKKRTALEKSTGREELGARFDEILSQMTGGANALAHDRGNWLERIRAKKVWRTVANQCFDVLDRGGREVRGAEKEKEVALALVRLPLDHQPEDFQELHRLIAARVGR
jgi:hypothetical protein